MYGVHHQCASVQYGGDAAMQAMARVQSWFVAQCHPELQNSDGDTVVMRVAARCSVETVKCMMQG